MNTKICVYCQQEFIPNTTRQIYCSKKCSKEAEKAKIRAKNEEKRLQGKICAKCGNTFIPKRYGSTRRYCFDCVPDGLSNGAQIRAIIKQWGLDYLGRQCVRCGYDKCLDALDFHHKDDATKEFTISDRNIKLDWELIKIELDKCEVLCANCHREEHSKKKE